MKVYVEAQSKAALIRRLAAGEEITGLNYSMFGGGGYYKLDNTLEDGTIIAIYSQMSNGNPVAKSWGTWTNGVLKAETFEAYDPADAWDNHIHQQEMALEAYQEYLDYSGENPLMTLEEWMEWQADLEDEYLEQQWKDMQEEDEPSPEDDPEYTTLEGTLDAENLNPTNKLGLPNYNPYAKGGVFYEDNFLKRNFLLTWGLGMVAAFFLGKKL